MIHYMTTIGVGDAWVGNELRRVAARGIPVRLHALRRAPVTYFAADDIAEMARETRALYPLPPLGLLGDVLAAPLRFRARFLGALWNALAGRRESVRVRLAGLWHLAVACHWAGRLAREGAPVAHIHSQWIHSGGTVAYFGAWLLGRPYSFTGHATDLFRDRAALADKIRRAAFIVCISEFHRRFYLAEGAREAQLVLVYCGIDTGHFAPVARPRAEGEPFRILASGRLVAKKGFDVLIRACARLAAQGIDVRCTIAGSGPLEDALRAQVAAAGLGDRVALTGEALRQEDIPGFMAGGHAYCLPCVQAPDGDIDGLPQMLMEAMACGLPAVSTDLVGIPDLVRDGETGLLAPPGDAEALAAALARLAADPDLAARLAAAGRAHVEAAFDIETCLEPLVARYRAALEGCP